MTKLSTEYLEQLKKLHSTSSFGSGKGLPKDVVDLINNDTKSILDFGSGKGYTSEWIKNTYPNINLYTYDPVTSPIQLPTEVDITYSSDVLEHVEPAHIDQTLDTLFSITKKYQYHLIACHPAKKLLSDGRNAHLIVESPEWWKNKLQKYNWEIVSEKIKENYREKFNLNIIKYIVLLRNKAE